MSSVSASSSRSSPDREGRFALGDPVARRLLHSLAQLPDHRLQGHAQCLAAACLLPGPRRRACRERHRHGALAFLDKHFPILAKGPSIPLHLAQRRDQHSSRQRQLDARPPVAVQLQAIRRRADESPAGYRHGRLRLGHPGQRPGVAIPVRPLPGPRPDDDGARALAASRVDGAGEEGLLRVPCLPYGAVGRTRFYRLHGRDSSRRHARPERPSTCPLLANGRRPRRHGL